LGRRGIAKFRDEAYVILQLNSAGRVELDFLQGLPDDIVRLALALLSGLDSSGLVKVALVVDIKLAKSVS
jgi:hypothetical protein